MSTFAYDVEYPRNRNRLTVAFRIFLAIPHLIIAGVWREFCQILAVVQWFIIVFTGKRNQALWDLQRSYIHYYSRVIGYIDLLFDEYPAFASSAGPAPVRSDISFDENADRLTTGLRFIWAIPAVIIGIALSIAGAVIVLISWFAIVITGKQSRGMWEFVLKVVRFSMQLESYVLLMTDTYPKYGEGAMATSTSTPPPTSFAPPQPA